MVLVFGSRSGSWFALCLFAAIFAVLGWGIAREIRRRSQGRHQMLGIVIGFAVFAAPVTAIYASSLSGFYEAVAVGRALRLQYLPPGIVSEIALDSISDVRAVPAYKLSWRLIVTTSSGERFESATSGRASVIESMSRLNDHRNAATQPRRPLSFTGHASRTLTGVSSEIHPQRQWRSLKELLREYLARPRLEKSLESTGQRFGRELHRDDEPPGSEVSRLQRLSCVVRSQSRREVGGTANVMACGVFPAADHIHNASIGHAQDQARLMPHNSVEFLEEIGGDSRIPFAFCEVRRRARIEKLRRWLRS